MTERQRVMRMTSCGTLLLIAAAVVGGCVAPRSAPGGDDAQPTPPITTGPSLAELRNQTCPLATSPNATVSRLRVDADVAPEDQETADEIMAPYDQGWAEIHWEDAQQRNSTLTIHGCVVFEIPLDLEDAFAFVTIPTNVSGAACVWARGASVPVGTATIHLVVKLRSVCY